VSEVRPQIDISRPNPIFLAARYALGAAAFLALAVYLQPESGGWWLWLWLWPALSLALLAICHLREDPSWMGKQPDGSIRFVSRLLFAPYFVFVAEFAGLKRRLVRQPPWHLVAEGLYVGRRPTRGDLPADVRTVVDLTCEFPATPTALAAEHYFCLPTLNRWIVPTPEVSQFLARLRDVPQPIYIHCGAGKGRSALLAAAILLDRGLVDDAESAFRLVHSARPYVSLHRIQWWQLLELAGELRDSG
jgi:hypothetical protein